MHGSERGESRIDAFLFMCYSDQVIGRKDIIYLKEIQMNYFLESFLTES